MKSAFIEKRVSVLHRYGDDLASFAKLIYRHNLTMALSLPRISVLLILFLLHLRLHYLSLLYKLYHFRSSSCWENYLMCLINPLWAFLKPIQLYLRCLLDSRSHGHICERVRHIALYLERHTTDVLWGSSNQRYSIASLYDADIVVVVLRRA